MKVQIRPHRKSPTHFRHGIRAIHNDPVEQPSIGNQNESTDADAGTNTERWACVSSSAFVVLSNWEATLRQASRKTHQSLRRLRCATTCHRQALHGTGTTITLRPRAPHATAARADRGGATTRRAGARDPRSNAPKQQRATRRMASLEKWALARCTLQQHKGRWGLRLGHKR